MANENYEALKFAELTSPAIDDDVDGIFKPALDTLDPELVSEIIRARQGLNYAILREAGLTTETIDNSDKYKAQLNQLPLELILELVGSVDELVDDGGQDFS